MIRLFIKIFSIIFAILTLSTCQKYEDGGTLLRNRKHLFGHKKDNASKTWKLKLYEVNGIDSTNLINGTSVYHDNCITFILDNKEGYSGKAKNFLFDYIIDLGSSPSEEIIIGHNNFPPTSVDSLQCDLGKNACARNIFVPELNGIGGSGFWQIKKLTKKEFIIENDKLKNTYKIMLESN
jgi:hypothetical protein